MITVYDRLYGAIDFSNEDLKLLQTPDFARTHQISLSAVPTWTQPTSHCDSRAQHGIGSGYLGKIMGERPEFKDVAQEIFLALLGHDIGVPPFSHMSEHFMQRILGKDHMQNAQEAICDSDFARLGRARGADMDRVYRFINGKEPPFCYLVNRPGGIDGDNIDNCPRFALSMGLCTTSFYDPARLARAFRFDGERIYLDARAMYEIPNWELMRRKVYDFIYSPANLTPGMMIFRAIELALRDSESHLTPDFFRLNDSQAYEYLSNLPVLGTRKLMEKAARWQYFSNVYTLQTSEELPKLLALLKNGVARTQIADELSRELRIPPEDICAYAGKGKGYKKIGLDVRDEDGTKHDLLPTELKPTWYVLVFVDPFHATERTRECVKQYLTALLK